MGILSFFLGPRLNKPGVYRIRNRKNGKVYIGSTQRSIRVRLDEHVWRLSTGTHPNTHLQADWDEHGQRAFTFKVLENTPAAQAEMRELHWQLRTPRGMLYGRIVQPAEIRQQRAEWCRQSFIRIIDKLIASGWTDEDFNRVFKPHAAAIAIAHRATAAQFASDKR